MKTAGRGLEINLKFYRLRMHLDRRRKMVKVNAMA